jgi:hypothetical protein
MVHNVNRRFQIVISQQPARAEHGAPSQLGRFGRLKTLLVGLIVAATVIAVLVVALILGYIIAAILCIVIVIAIAGLLLKSTFQRARH